MTELPNNEPEIRLVVDRCMSHLRKDLEFRDHRITASVYARVSRKTSNMAEAMGIPGGKTVLEMRTLDEPPMTTSVTDVRREWVKHYGTLDRATAALDQYAKENEMGEKPGETMRERADRQAKRAMKGLDEVLHLFDHEHHALVYEIVAGIACAQAAIHRQRGAAWDSLSEVEALPVSPEFRGSLNPKGSPEINETQEDSPENVEAALRERYKKAKAEFVLTDRILQSFRKAQRLMNSATVTAEKAEQEMRGVIKTVSEKGV